MKKIVILISYLLLSFIWLTESVSADFSSSFVSIVNPVRGQDFWQLQNQLPEDAVFGEMKMLQEYNFPATWLIRYDALNNSKITSLLANSPNQEKGIFLEVTPSWTKDAQVTYRNSASWHSAGSAFLTGYERQDRERLIDSAFDRFKRVFGNYPTSVGAWWIDSYSLDYMQKKYQITSALVVADQYTTDNYQIWGQFWSTPYYPAKKDALNPAQTLEGKLPIVMVQWAARDPINGYGDGVQESTYSVQPNDYMDYHKLKTDYFTKLVDIYTKQPFNDFGQLVIGLENSYSWQKYSGEYKNQLRVLKDKSDSGQLRVITMSNFASWYKSNFPNLSPSQIIVADDPLGSEKKVVWFMNNYYRAGWFYNKEGSVFRDIRQYIDGEEEICFQKACNELNFATFATRVLDDVTYGHKLIIDEGKISNFQVKSDNKIILSYINEAGKSRQIQFLPRDIGIDNKISSIDGTILDATKADLSRSKPQLSNSDSESLPSFKLQNVFIQVVTFILFLYFACIIPGRLVTIRINKEQHLLTSYFLSAIIGLVILTTLFYLLSILQLRFLLVLYIGLSFLALIFFKLWKELRFWRIKSISKLDWLILCLIVIGTIFQVIPTFRSGLLFSYGIGFWGPNTHDGVWHIALINQLLDWVPPFNPVYAGNILRNYHFFYDLLVTTSFYLTRIPVTNLFFRFFPILLSLLLGVGSYLAVKSIFLSRLGIIKVKVAAILGLYLIFFCGSFGWIVEFLQQRHFGGESAFWANQALSFNLNPPFASSLVIILAIIQLIIMSQKQKNLWLSLSLILLMGTLVGFKAYGAILIFISLFILVVLQTTREKNWAFLPILILAASVSLVISFVNFDFQNSASSSLFKFAPFWFIHSMIDSPDRVGWTRLTLARIYSQVNGQWPKFLTVEAISLLIFIFGNLGIRTIGLLSLGRIKFWYKDNVLFFLFIMTLSSLSIPIFYIQNGNPWNTIQFFYYGMYILALVSGVVFSLLIIRLPRIWQISITLLLLVVAPINSIVGATGYLAGRPHGLISKDEFLGLKFLAGQSAGTVLTVPYDKKLKEKIAEPWPLFAYDSTAYVSAFSKKQVFIEDEPQNQILLTNYLQRLVGVRNFFNDLQSDAQYAVDSSNHFLKQNNIKYLYLPQIYKIGFDERRHHLQKIFENERIKIYRTSFEDGKT